jgi:hypothetical protein
MAARIEDGVEVLPPDAVKAKGLAELRFCGRILLEAEGEVSTELRLIALRIERRPPALWRCQRDVNSRILEGVVVLRARSPSYVRCRRAGRET